jgi:hypothetical protein
MLSQEKRKNIHQDFPHLWIFPRKLLNFVLSRFAGRMPMHRFIKIRIIRDFEHLEERVRRWRDTPVELGESGVSFRPPGPEDSPGGTPG